MNCPRCRAALLETDYEGLGVYHCHSCRGYWVPGARLAEIAEIREKTFTTEQKAAFQRLHAQARTLVNQADAEISCPRCGQALRQNRYPYANEVIIDRCPQGHGIWLDAGEIEHIQMAVEQQQDEMSETVLEQDLAVDDFQSQQLLAEREKYSFSLRRGLMWFVS